jgi:hypothetical protein
VGIVLLGSAAGYGALRAQLARQATDIAELSKWKAHQGISWGVRFEEGTKHANEKFHEVNGRLTEVETILRMSGLAGGLSARKRSLTGSHMVIASEKHEDE